MKVKFLFVLLFVMLSACSSKPQFVTPCDGCTRKVQPNGVDPDRDLKEAQANNYNGQGDAGSGEYILKSAQATAIVEQASWGTGSSTSYRVGAFSGAMCGIGLLLGFLFFIVLPLHVFLNSPRFRGRRPVKETHDQSSEYELVTGTHGKHTFKPKGENRP